MKRRIGLIYVLKEGRLMETGTHEELYEHNGTYREIFNASARSLNLDKISRTLEPSMAAELGQ
jgi:ABC-type transport system involved in cytochrome bd biosynthesis fused ATPase/permease subunit